MRHKNVKNFCSLYKVLPAECTLKDLTNGFNFENSNGIKSSKIISGTNFTIDNTKYTGTINDLGTSEFTLTVTVNNAGTNIDVFFNMTLTVTGPETYSVTLHTNGGTISEGKDVTSYTEWTGAALPSSADITNEAFPAPLAGLTVQSLPSLQTATQRNIP